MIKQIKKSKPVQNKDKLLGLEIIRFISSISILIWHYQHFFYTNEQRIDFVKENQPFYSFLSLFYEYGFYGVHVFWSISGFIFFWKYRETIASKALTYKKFFVLRFSRLYPLHLFTLLLTLVLQRIYYSKANYFFIYQNNDILHFIYQLFLASNWGFEKGYSYNGPIWSISIEVLIYCFFFVVLQKISKSFFLNIIILLLCFVIKYLKITNPIFSCLALFYIGGLSAILYNYTQNNKFTKLAQYLCLFLLLTTPFLMAVKNIYQQKYFQMLFLILYAPLLLFLSAFHFSAPNIIQKTIKAAGNMTYSIYLLHFPLQLLIAFYFLYIDQKIPYYSNIFFLGFIGTTLILSYCAYKFFELPIQQYIRRKLLIIY